MAVTGLEGRLKIETPGSSSRAFEEICATIGRRMSATPVGVCSVDLTLNVLRMCHAQSCGKCTPCRIGLAQVADMLEKVLDSEADISVIDEIDELSTAIMDTADCAIGYEAAALVKKSIANFRDDYESHITKGHCSCSMKYATPCIQVCPAHVDVPGYIALIKAGRNEDAVRLIRQDNPFPGVCGYVCEHPCEKRCRRELVDAAINICGLKRYAVDHAKGDIKPECAESTGKRVAVVGGGPGGLTTAYFLTLMGHKVTVYEQRDKLGGMLRYGIPDYRLPQAVLDKDIEFILNTGVETVMGKNIGDDIDLEVIKKKYDAVYISIGAHADKKLGIDGEEGEGVISAIRMLRHAGEGRPMDMKGKRVCVIGGGNVAMDATRTALRLGASSVKCVYRRRVDDMTALKEEIEEAQAEGVEMVTLSAPDHIELDSDNKVKALWVKPQMVSVIGSDGRVSVKTADSDLKRIECDVVVVAIGQSIQTAKFEERGIATNRGTIHAELSTFVPESGNVFAGGDAVSGPATVIRAIAAGKVAAANIDNFLGFNHVIKTDIDIPAPSLTNAPACGRVTLASEGADDLTGDFNLRTQGMSDQEAMQECGRCLRCDHFGLGAFKGGRNLQW